MSLARDGDILIGVVCQRLEKCGAAGARSPEDDCEYILLDHTK